MDNVFRRNLVKDQNDVCLSGSICPRSSFFHLFVSPNPGFLLMITLFVCSMSGETKQNTVESLEEKTNQRKIVNHKQ